MDALVNDEQTYEELKRDPTPALQQLLTPQVAQARNMSIGVHRHCCVTFKI